MSQVARARLIGKTRRNEQRLPEILMGFDGQYDKIRLDSSPTNKEMFHMNQESQHQNLQVQLQETITHLDKITDQLESAKRWSWADLLGGEFITSMVKRKKMKNISEDLQQLQPKLQHLKHALEDANIQVDSAIDHSTSRQFFDTFFDNIITDLKVQGEIKDMLAELKELRQALTTYQQQIDSGV